MASSRGYSVVDSALYAESGWVKQWVAGAGIKTIIQPDSMITRRINEVKVLNGSNGQLWTTGVYQYDGGGNIKNAGSDVFTYDSIGRLAEARLAAPSGGTLYGQTFAYDPFGNIVSRSQTVTPGPPTSITGYIVNPANNRIDGIVGFPGVWAYDSDGALRQDDQFQYNYDNARRLKQVQVGGSDKGNYSYDAFGLRVYRKEDHGKEVFYFRDADGNVLSQYSRPSDVAALVPQWDRDYVYFGGNRINMVENPVPIAVAWKTSQATSTQISLEWYANSQGNTYGYLVLKKGPYDTDFHPILPGTTPVTTTGASYPDSQVSNQQTYTYKVVAIDNAGNQGIESAERIITAGDTTPPPAPSSLAATAGNAYVSLTWAQSTSPPDLAGYFVYRSPTSLGTEVYGTALNSVPITTRAYTDLAVTNGTTYYYKVRAVDTAGLKSTQSNQVSAKPKSFGMGMNFAPDSWQRGDGSASDLRVAEGAEGGGAISPYAIAGQMAGANVLFLHSDHLGSLRLVTNSLGAVVTEHKYLPYGEEIQPMRTMNPYRFAGYERDSESGKDYVRARYYSANLGRWQTPDPLGDGFEYSINSPLNFNDPTGLTTTPQCHRVCVTTRVGPWGPERTCWNECRDVLVVDDDIAPPDPLESPYGDSIPYGGEVNGDSPPPKPCDYSVSREMGTTQFLIGVASAAWMLGEFLSGYGEDDRTFSSLSAVSQLMASSAGVGKAVREYVDRGLTSGESHFGAAGPFVAGWNPMQQFVGTFDYSISPGNGGLDLTLSNDTSVYSGSYHQVESHQRSSFRPMGTIHQTYHVFVPCHN